MASKFSQTVTFLYVKNLPRSLAFYQEALDLEVALVQDGCIILSIDGGSHAFIGLCTCAESRPTAGMIFTLVANELDAIHSRLTAHGYTPDGPPRFNERFNITHFFVNDPDGHLIEIQTFHASEWPLPKGI